MMKHLLNYSVLLVLILAQNLTLWGNNPDDVSTQKKEMLLVEAIGMISRDYNVYFTFDHELVKDITVEYETRKDLTVEEAISGVLQGTDLKFKLYDKRFVILYQNDEKGLESLKEMVKHFEHIIADGPERKKARRNFKPVTAIPLREAWIPPARKLQNLAVNVSGTVTDQTGEVLIGVNIQVKGSNKGAATDFDGKYTLNDVNENAILVFSYVGYQKQEIPVDGRSSVDVTMLTDAQLLDEVVGYGTQRKADITGAVSTVSGETLRETPVANLTNAMAGRVSGVLAVNDNGRPGSGSRLQIRGLSTLNNNAPLVVVDGIVQSDFDNIDPNDVESISILKDAASTAVYGARAANGVFLITTKRGLTGDPKITYSGRVGVQKPTQYPELMSGYQYSKLKNEVLINSGVSENDPELYTKNQLEDFKAGKGTVNWYDETFKKNSMVNQHNISVNGGNKAVRYFGSIGYLDQEGMYDEINFKRYNFRTNVDARISKSINIGLNLSGREQFSNTSGYDANSIFREVTQTTNLLPGAYWPDGLPVNTSGQNPAAMINSSGYSAYENNFFVGTFFMDIDLFSIIEGLSFKGTVSVGKKYDYVKWFQTPYASYDKDEQGNITNVKVNGGNTSLQEFYTQEQSITGNISLKYDKVLHKHKIGALFLAEQYSDKGNKFSAYKQDFAVDLRDEFFASGPQNQSISGNAYINDFRKSLVGRLNYAYDGRYLFEGSFRYDGSYRFPKNRRYGFFPGFSLGWNISDEPFFINSKALKFVDNLKFRVSKGVIGNDRVNAFQFEDSYSITTNRGPVFNGEAAAIVNYGVFPNPDITWERQENNNIGLESVFLNGKLGLDFEYFYRITKDILWSKSRSVPDIFGRSLPSANYAEVQSKGIELTLNHQNSLGSVYYNFKLIGSYATNNVTKIDDPANALDYQLQLGRPVGYVAGFESLGIFDSQQEADQWFEGNQFSQKSIAGDIKYADVDMDGRITENDQKILSKYGRDPAIIYGFSGLFKWNNFDFNFLIQGAAKRTLLLNGYGRQAFRSGGATGTFAYMIDSWSPNNMDSKYPIAVLSPRSINEKTSDIWLRKAGYARLKSINLGYNFPLIIQNINNMRIYISGFNLLTWSQISEFDPEAEVGSGSYYPQQKTVNFGINLTF